MARLVKAYNEEGDIVFEVAVTAMTERGARARGVVSLLGRRPGGVTALREVDVMQLMSEGFVNEYRVMVRLDPQENLRDKLRLTDAVEAFERLV